MAWILEQTLVAATALLLAAVLAGYAMYLRRRLDAALRASHDMAREFGDAAAESKRSANIDAMTGVANRRNFDEVLSKEWARAMRAQQPLAIIMVDIDRFKLHNDTYGHQAGDECLKQVAAVLKRSVRRPVDLVARYGGEEFSVILPGAEIAGAATVAERMRADVQALKIAHVNNVTGSDVTISLGVAVIVPNNQSSALELVASADEALYRAKAVGRNQVIVADMVESDSETIEF